MQLRIEQQFARIGMNIQKPLIILQSTLPVIELDIKEPMVEIHSPRPKVYIDQTRCFADAGKRTPEEFARYNADLAYSEGMQAIGDIAAKGDMLAAIEKGYTIEQMAADAMNNQADFNVTAIPKQPPKIDWDIRPVDVKLNRGSVDLRLNQGRIENHTQYAQITTYLRQKNYLQIDWIDNKIDTIA